MKQVQKFILIIYVLIWIFPARVEAQELLHTFPEKIDFFTLDNLGNPILVKGQDMKKFNTYLELEAQNSNKFTGTISKLDATNALKILVFNQELSQINILDNKLGARGASLSLEKLGFEQVSVIASSYNNGIWLFDQLHFELIRLDQNMEFSIRSGNLLQIIKHALFPSGMIESGKWLYINVPDLGILVFDIFGTYYKSIPLKNVSAFQIGNEQLYYLQDGKIYSYHFLSLETKELFGKAEKIKDFSIHKNKLYIQIKNELFVYKI